MSLLRFALHQKVWRCALSQSVAPAAARNAAPPTQSAFLCRDGRRFIWAIDSWSERRKQPVIRSDAFSLTGSERTWVLSRTAETDSLHLTCSGADRTCRELHGGSLSLLTDRAVVD